MGIFQQLSGSEPPLDFLHPVQRHSPMLLIA
jgi:hypothetical protein